MGMSSNGKGGAAKKNKPHALLAEFAISMGALPVKKYI